MCSVQRVYNTKKGYLHFISISFSLTELIVNHQRFIGLITFHQATTAIAFATTSTTSIYLLCARIPFFRSKTVEICNSKYEQLARFPFVNNDSRQQQILISIAIASSIFFRRVSEKFIRIRFPRLSWLNFHHQYEINPWIWGHSRAHPRLTHAQLTGHMVTHLRFILFAMTLIFIYKSHVILHIFFLLFTVLIYVCVLLLVLSLSRSLAQ